MVHITFASYGIVVSDMLLRLGLDISALLDWREKHGNIMNFPGATKIITPSSAVTFHYHYHYHYHQSFVFL